MAEDIKLRKFFDMARWEAMLEKGCDKGIDMGLLRQLCQPQNRLQLLNAIANDNYRIAPPHIARIPKDNGEFREVYVNEPIDRIFLSLYNDVMFEMYGNLIHPSCKSYQKGIGCPQVVKEISHKICQMPNGCVGYKADLSKYFDNVRLDIIDKALDDLSTGSPLDKIVREYYHTDMVFDADGNLVEHYGSLKQGCAFASFLANYVLKDIDAVLNEMDILYYRYSDDILMIGKDADKALSTLQQMLKTKGLVLNPKKVEPLSKDKFFTFLGFNILGPNITFSKKSIKNLQKEIEARTIKANYSTEKAIHQVNKYLYEGYIVDDKQFGWAAYFLPTVNVKEDINEINIFVMDCIRAVDSGKKKIGGVGENKQLKCKVVCRGTGKNIRANRDKWKNKYGTDNIDGYLSLTTMKNALRMGKPVYEALLADIMI